MDDAAVGVAPISRLTFRLGYGSGGKAPTVNNMSRRLTLSLVAIIAILFLGAYIASPYVAVRDFIAAARSGDAARLNDAVDFPAVRRSLKPQVTEALTGRLGSPRKRSPLADLGKLLAPVIVDQALDTLVTPDSITQLVRHGDPHASGTGEAPKRRLSYSYSYAGLDRFRATLASPDHPASPASLIFERRNLFWWKLVRLELPKDILTGRKTDSGL